MQKKNNRFLNSYRTFFAGWGEDSGAWLWLERGATRLAVPDFMGIVKASSLLLAAAAAEQSEKPVRVLVNVGRDFLSREWFNEPLTTAGWRLESYNHEARTGHYIMNGYPARDITLTMASNWIFEPDTAKAQRQYEIAQEFFRNRFGFSFLGSPTMTGLYALEQTLPANAETSPSDFFLEILHNNTTQARTETFLPSEVKAFYYYDRRFAYAADCRLEMPCGRDFHHRGAEAKYVPYDPAFYRVSFEVPETWAHVGLLPVLTCDGWQWPQEGRHTAFVAEPELRVAIANGWEVTPLEAWRFGKARPLERWRNQLVEEWKAANLAGCKSQADMFRKILLHGIGGLYARSFTRERVIDAGDLGTIEGAEALSAEPIEGGFRTEHRVARGNRHYAPHWAAYTWSRARACLLNKMLTLPFPALLGCHVDAIYSSMPLAEIGEDVGKFRLKGALSFGSPQLVKDGRALLAIRNASEGVL